MATQYEQIGDGHPAFIEAQQMYFVATAARDGRVNVSPKGLDSLRVLGPNRVAWLNGTGSGNETAAHLLDSPRTGGASPGARRHRRGHAARRLRSGE